MTDVFGREGQRPTVACDTVVFTNINGVLMVLLVERGHAPFKGKWALPGGFLEWNESCEQGAARELREETGLKDLKLEQIGTFSEVGRDPRGTVVSVVYMTFADSEKNHPVAGDDAAVVRWWPADAHPPLAFDHEKVLAKALGLFRE